MRKPVQAGAVGASWTALQGSCFVQAWVPTQLRTKATEKFQPALHRYEHIPIKTFPDWA